MGMTCQDPQLDDEHTVVHAFDNSTQKNFFKDHEAEVMAYLRGQLQNYAIQLTTKIESGGDSKKQLYSGQDKFKDMAERNPHLKTLKQRFKLDIDF